MSLLRWSVRIHKWVALIIGLQILLWIAGGLVMSMIPIEQVRGEHKVAAPAPLSLSPNLILPLSEATDRAGLIELRGASIGQVMEQPVWRLTGTEGQRLVVNAQTGELMTPVSSDLAERIANADYSGTGQLKTMERLVDPPAEYGRPGPVWRATFDDGDATTLYIDPSTAEVRARRSSTWRFYDFFWKLHIMDYDDGADFNHPLLITAAGAAVFVALSGLILLIIKMRRTLLVWRHAKRGN
ncbi:MAG: PepSY domain-containing protein [Hyphomonas sp.]|jgi:uncharacterized iron-regulated membrane protein|nr:PepSY domain-containing protein [Hyphomonas sp.]